MHSIANSVPWLEALHRFNLDGFGRVQIHERTRRFGFQIQIRDLLSPPSLVFGLAQADSAEGNARFAVRIDLETSQIWDAAHDTGLIGYLDTACTPARMPWNSLSVRWEVERTGDALIPRLHLGDEEYLYPAVRLIGAAPFVAFTGHDALELDATDIFSASRVWCLDNLP